MASVRFLNVLQLGLQCYPLSLPKLSLILRNYKHFDRLNSARLCSTKPSPRLANSMVTITYVTREGECLTMQGKEGDSLLDIVNDNQLELDGYGICGGTLSCSTCHVILREEDYKKIEAPMKEEELDMLDLSCGQTKTSRLGCQVRVTKDLDGLVAHLPDLGNDTGN